MVTFSAWASGSPCLRMPSGCGGARASICVVATRPTPPGGDAFARLPRRPRLGALARACAQIGSLLATYVIETVGTQEYDLAQTHFLAASPRPTATAAPPRSPRTSAARGPDAVRAVRVTPVEPPPSAWELPDPALAEPGVELLGVGADLEPGTLLAAYRSGLFPMPVEGDGPLGWWSPGPARDPAARRAAGLAARCASPADGSRRRSTPRSSTVVAACGDPRRPDGWITDEVRRGVLRAAPARAGRTPSRPAPPRAISSAGCTAWRSAACSRASRCSAGRRRLEGRARRPRRPARRGRATGCRRRGCSTCSGAPTTSPRSGWSRWTGCDYLRCSSAALPLPPAF